MKNLPKEIRALRETDLKAMLKENVFFKVFASDENNGNGKFKIYIDVGLKRFQLYNQRAAPRIFNSLDTYYKYCQKLGIEETLIHVNKSDKTINKKKE